MSVIADYERRIFAGYFSTNFVVKHLKPKQAVGFSGHQAKRAMSKAGNLQLNLRHQKNMPADVNSVVWDIDEVQKLRQVLRLMQEVESRNSSGFYAANNVGHGYVTADSYHINTTAQGSRNKLVYRPFRYDMILIGGAAGNRYIINHFAGIEA